MQLPCGTVRLVLLAPSMTHSYGPAYSDNTLVYRRGFALWCFLTWPRGEFPQCWLTPVRRNSRTSNDICPRRRSDVGAHCVRCLTSARTVCDVGPHCWRRWSATSERRRSALLAPVKPVSRDSIFSGWSSTMASRGHVVVPSRELDS